MATRVTLTYSDYAAIPNDGRRYEVHEGELAVTPAPGTRHQQVSRNLLVLLHAHVLGHGLGEILDAPIDCILEDTTVVQPDLVFVGQDRLAVISARGIEGRRAWSSKCCPPAPSRSTGASRLSSTHATACPTTGSSISMRG